LDSNGNIYVAELYNHRISKWNSSGIAQGWIGGGFDGWQTGNTSNLGVAYKYFTHPRGLCLDSNGNIYVAEMINNRVSKWNSSGIAQGWIGGGFDGWQTGNAPSTFGTDYRSFYYIEGLCVNNNGTIFVADRYNHRISVWNRNGIALGWIGNGFEMLQTSDAPVTFGVNFKSFNYPTKIIVDTSGNLYVSDEKNNRISKWQICQ